MYKIGNFSVDFISSGFIGEGYTDVFNADWSSGISAMTEYTQPRRNYATHANGKYMYDFCVIPLVGFLGNQDPRDPRTGTDRSRTERFGSVLGPDRTRTEKN